MNLSRWSVNFTVLLLEYLVFSTATAERRGPVKLLKPTQHQNLVGNGYSGDRRQVVSQKCYKAIVASIDEDEDHARLGGSISFSELQKQLGLSVASSGKYEMFSPDTDASYLRSVQDRKYSLSLNYYSRFANKVAVQLAGNGYMALTEAGRNLYNDGKNPQFGLDCGDYYITSYKQGALLILSINVLFNSLQSQNTFRSKVGSSFGDILSASNVIEKGCIDNRIYGSFTVQAFQIGGEPNKLSEILTDEGNKGQFYNLTCSLNKMKKCVLAANVLLSYAKEEFPTQVSLEENKGLTPLGVGLTQYESIENIGLTRPVSLVTRDVQNLRNKFSTRLKDNGYYAQILRPYVRAYEYEDTPDVKDARSLLSKAVENVNILLRRHEGAADCFNFPKDCRRLKVVLAEKLHSVTARDLDILNMAINFQTL